MVSFAHVRTQAHDIFLFPGGSCPPSVLEKKKRPEQCRYVSTRIAPASVVAYQPRWSVSNVIFCVRAAFAALIALFSMYPGQPDRSDGIFRIEPIS